MRVNEPISVITKDDGSPISFTWRKVRYLAISEPERWFARVSWWRYQNSLPDRTPPIERALWRVTALPFSRRQAPHLELSEEGTYDLCVTSDGHWLLVEAQSDSLELKLFA